MIDIYQVDTPEIPGVGHFVINSFMRPNSAAANNKRRRSQLMACTRFG